VCNAVGLLILLKLCPVFTFLQQLMTKGLWVIYTYIYVYMYTCICIYVYVYMYIRIYIYIYVYIYIIYTYILLSRIYDFMWGRVGQSIRGDLNFFSMFVVACVHVDSASYSIITDVVPTALRNKHSWVSVNFKVDSIHIPWSVDSVTVTRTFHQILLCRNKGVQGNKNIQPCVMSKWNHMLCYTVSYAA